MKKFVCLVALVMLLLSFAGCGEKAPDPDVTPTTTTVETTTTTERVTTPTTYEEWAREDRELNNKHASDFVDALRDGNVNKLGFYMNSDELAQLVVDTVEFEEITFIPTETDDPPRLRLRVTKSGYDPIPVGVSEWWVYAEYKVYLCPVDEDYKARWGRWNEFNKHGAVRFCAGAAATLDLFETVEDFSKLPAEWYVQEAGMIVNLHNRMQKAFRPDESLADSLTTEHLSAYIQNIFGATVTDFTASDRYVVLQDREEVRLGFYGGPWNYYTLVSHTQKGDVHTVTLRFYADAFHLIEAVTMRYTVQELPNGEYRMLSCKQLSRTDYPPAQGST